MASRNAEKYYAVVKGRQTGIYTHWPGQGLPRWGAGAAHAAKGVPGVGVAVQEHHGDFGGIALFDILEAYPLGERRRFHDDWHGNLLRVAMHGRARGGAGAASVLHRCGRTRFGKCRNRAYKA